MNTIIHSAITIALIMPAMMGAMNQSDIALRCSFEQPDSYKNDVSMLCYTMKTDLFNKLHQHASLKACTNESYKAALKELRSKIALPSWQVVTIDTHLDYVFLNPRDVFYRLFQCIPVTKATRIIDGESINCYATTINGKHTLLTIKPRTTFPIPVLPHVGYRPTPPSVLEYLLSAPNDPQPYVACFEICPLNTATHS